MPKTVVAPEEDENDEIVVDSEEGSIVIDRKQDEFLEALVGSPRATGKENPKTGDVEDPDENDEEVEGDGEDAPDEDADPDAQPDEGQPSSPRGDEEDDIPGAIYAKAMKDVLAALMPATAPKGEDAPKAPPKDDFDRLAETPDAEFKAKYEELCAASRFQEAERYVARTEAARAVVAERGRSKILEDRLDRLEKDAVSGKQGALESALDAAAGAREKWEPLRQEIGEVLFLDTQRQAAGLKPRCGMDAKKLLRAAQALKAGETGAAMAPAPDRKKKVALGKLPLPGTAKGGPVGKKGKAGGSEKEYFDLLNREFSQTL